ncbi:hypothetical protein [Mesorhizobium sp. M4B.F.Ca.ET.058.02.1.1]|uniref:hypothetical protein n=1 Tax=Mesorhizobium sp. M4B.F.Ca.ET.058.02.1.1 TaxID=2493675 RepID=UPI000F765769|nr:hypothetical protein [Mesorhizobium sp. M4B.F.Ca.ET.058.02.1.1]AZO48031.1 hypothetical protein EJ073_09520 [Mesorhizobium sp. M4B.F.Ca.ET.058.02.1.1]
MSDKIHFWLVAAQVVVVNPKTGDQRVSLNALLTTKENYIARLDLANAQKAVLGRFSQTAELGKDDQVADVFTVSISHLGHMTPDEFHAGFNDAPAAPAAANQVN